MYHAAARVLALNSTMSASGHPKPESPRSESGKSALHCLGGMLAAVPPALGKALMWLGKYFEGNFADKDDSKAHLRVVRVEDADPWVAPPVFWC